ncbi:ABC transporter permease [Mycetocola reblochoni]|uniref:Autoinducer 2 import system permease protein LsrC n=2 Tax=Mycetocola reblochoni TaxID=331618 RepID=A0A1R4IHE3_9MICO|nr:ABC transporter permease [Mycetocola reblochoni]RLP69685.1 ABC transporter permease [Mycetocola reblochoni]SJN19168.1 Ribose ABC transport system, permease protein RbsC (TC 3.A.1.2.1) [Mycetocola reblochoni REB411]
MSTSPSTAPTTETVSIPLERPGAGRRVKAYLDGHRSLVGVAAIVLLLVLGGIIRPGFASADNIGSLLAIAAILTLLACSQVFVVVSGGEGIDLSVAAVASMSAVLASMFLSRADGALGSALAIGGVLLIALVIGAVTGLAVAFARIPPLVMTLGMAQLIAGAVFAYTAGSAPSSAPGWLAELGAARAFGPVRWLVLVVAVLVVAGELWLRRTRSGRSLFLVGANDGAARLSGLRIRSIRLLAYTSASVTGAVAGILLLGSAGSAQLGMADGYLLLSIAAVIIGGARFSGGEGSFAGAAIGAVLLTVLDSLLLVLGLGPGTRIAVQGAILLVLTLVYARERSLRS